MAKTRREFTPTLASPTGFACRSLKPAPLEFKLEAVALLESSGRPQMQIAAELGIQPSMLRQSRTTLIARPNRCTASARSRPTSAGWLAGSPNAV